MNSIGIFGISILLLSNLIFSDSLNTIKSLALIDFQGEGVEQSIANNFSNKFRKLILDDKRFSVMERDNMNSILKEQGYQHSGCMSTECVIDVGKLIGVNYVIAGAVGKVGKLYIINARLVNVETGKIDKEVERADKTSLENLYLSNVYLLYCDLFAKSDTSRIITADPDTSRVLFNIQTQFDEKLLKESSSSSSKLEIIKRHVVLPVYYEAQYFYYVKSPSGIWGFVSKTWVKNVSDR